MIYPLGVLVKFSFQCRCDCAEHNRNGTFVLCAQFLRVPQKLGTEKECHRGLRKLM